MNLVKREYENILALLGRVKVEGLAEAKEVVAIALKIENKVANWVDADINKVEALPAEVKAEIEKPA